MTTVENLIKALEAAESTLRRIAVKNEQVAEATLTQIKEGGGDATKWPGGWFEDIAEAALGRASICKGVIAAARAETHNDQASGARSVPLDAPVGREED